MKKILLSIRPEWCAKIFNGEKTIEVRRNSPKLVPPFEVLVYCTKGTKPLVWGSPCPTYANEKLTLADGYGLSKAKEIFGTVYNGKVIGSFVCDELYSFITWGAGAACIGNDWQQIPPERVIKETCLTEQQIMDYLERGIGNYEGYGWHITDAKLFDETKELKKFIRGCDDMLDPQFGSYCGYCPHPCFLTRPPQSWCYIET